MLAELLLASILMHGGDGHIRSRCLTATISSRDTCPYYVVDTGFVAGPFSLSACGAIDVTSGSRYWETENNFQRFTFDTGILWGISIWNSTKVATSPDGPTLGGLAPASNIASNFWLINGNETITPASGLVSPVQYMWGRPVIHLAIGNFGGVGCQ